MIQDAKNKQISTKKNPSRPSRAQFRYLYLGFDQPGGKLPLFDGDGQEIPVRTIKSCIVRGWCEPWFDNPIKRDWIVCRLTEKGRDVVKTQLMRNAQTLL